MFFIIDRIFTRNQQQQVDIIVPNWHSCSDIFRFPALLQVGGGFPSTFWVLKMNRSLTSERFCFEIIENFSNGSKESYSDFVSWRTNGKSVGIEWKFMLATFIPYTYQSLKLCSHDQIRLRSWITIILVMIWIVIWNWTVSISNFACRSKNIPIGIFTMFS